jgi:hypothetical protein
MDLAFWCLHEYFPQLAVLALPTIAGTALMAGIIAGVIRTWNLPFIFNYILYSMFYPISALTIVTMGPLPCAVFAWHRAAGRVATPQECFQQCLTRFGRIAVLGVRLLLCYLFWFLLLGIPMFIFWPRTCLAPLVALFENERKIFVRCRRLLKEENTVVVLAALYTLLSISLGVLIAIPRLLLLAQITQAPWTRLVNRYLWAFEFLSGTILVTGMAVSWCLSLTFLYCDIRRIREGEELREKVRGLRQKLAGAGTI